MRRRPPLLALLVALAATPATAVAGVEPLWVPDPREPVAEAEPDGALLEVSAAVASDAPAAGDPTRVAVAHWLASGAREAGLPGELAVMAALVESGLRNLPYGDADSVGLFQMRLGIWNSGPYEGYLTRPELQLRWFVEHALAVREARRAAGDEQFGTDPDSWGEWIADIERPFAAYRGRYAQRLGEARALLALPAPAVAPFELGLTVGGAATPVADPAAAEAAARVLREPAITLDDRARGDLEAGRIDARVSALLLEAAARAPISVTVLQTGHSYYTVNGSVSNHSFGRAVDIGMVDGAAVDSSNAAARDLALALGQLDEPLRPTEIGTPWAIDEPGYFTDGDHREHLHVGYDDPPAAAAAAVALPAVKVVPVRRRASSPAEPRFDAASSVRGRGGSEPRFEVKR